MQSRHDNHIARLLVLDQAFESSQLRLFDTVHIL
jgi:hypothetical protein